MDFIPQVQCRRCGTEYSSLQSRCPKCGARKMKQTQRAPGTTSGTVAGTYANEQAQLNVRWQMTFAAILVVAVILSMIVLISTSLSTAPDRGDNQTGKDPGQTVVDSNTSPTPTPTPTPSPTPTPQITSLALYYNGQAIAGNPPQFTEAINEEVPLTLSFYPLNVPVTVNDVKWTSADESVCKVVGDNMGCKVIGVGTGSTTVTVKLFNQEYTITVFVRESW